MKKNYTLYMILNLLQYHQIMIKLEGRVDSEGVLLEGHEEPAPAVEQKVEENKRPVVIIRKKSSVPKALPKKLVGLKKPVDVKKRSNKFKGFKCKC